MKYIFKMEEHELWWGGTSTDGIISPFDKSTVLKHDFRVLADNQSMPMYISNMGRCIWSEEPFEVSFLSGEIKIIGKDVIIEKFGNTLRDAYTGASKKYFPQKGEKLPEKFFTTPQYNTWMQLVYDQSQKGVMDYAKNIIKNGFAPGILIIDEGWQKDYGKWQFDEIKFPEPKQMIDELHAMGFTVMLWVVPFVGTDGKDYAMRVFKGLSPDKYQQNFLRNENGKPLITEWWNGYSSILDFTNEYDKEYLDSQLQSLIDEFSIDGFKFDGGCLASYCDTRAVNGPINKMYTPAQRNIAWNEFGLKYSYHEYKDTFKGGGKRCIQRLFDKFHSWDNNGLNTLIPNALSAGLMGYPFICPDMIGGGEWTIRENNQRVDMELFVRMAQCSALFPMMQFSWAPWEAVDKQHLKYIKDAHDLHIRFADRFRALVEQCYKDNEPVLRSLEYNYPHCGFERVKDMFMLGNDILAAPVIVKGQKVRKVTLPQGKWKGFNGIEYYGNKTYEIPVTLADTVYFTKM